MNGKKLELRWFGPTAPLTALLSAVVIISIIALPPTAGAQDTLARRRNDNVLLARHLAFGVWMSGGPSDREVNRFDPSGSGEMRVWCAPPTCQWSTPSRHPELPNTWVIRWYAFAGTSEQRFKLCRVLLLPVSTPKGSARPEVIRTECSNAALEQTVTPDSAAAVVLNWGGNRYVHVCQWDEVQVKFCGLALSEEEWSRALVDAARERKADSVRNAWDNTVEELSSVVERLMESAAETTAVWQQQKEDWHTMREAVAALGMGDYSRSERDSIIGVLTTLADGVPATRNNMRLHDLLRILSVATHPDRQTGPNK